MKKERKVKLRNPTKEETSEVRGDDIIDPKGCHMILTEYLRVHISNMD